MHPTPRPPHAAPDDERRAALAAGIARQLRRALNDALAAFGSEPLAEAPPLTVPRALHPTGPTQLAAAHPGGAVARAQAQALYEHCLAQYRTLFAPPAAGRDVDDVGAAMAHFVAANVEALHGSAATPAVLRRLAAQLAAIVRASIGWSRAGVAERQAYFERLAILATLVAESSAQAASQGSDAVEHVRRAARGYLHELLGIDPDALTLGPCGLALRVAAADGARCAAGTA